MGFRVRPGAPHGASNRANEFGFNDDDYPFERLPGTCRILILGDSFNWIGGRQWNYVDLLEKRLKARFGSRIEVINAGYPATHPSEQLKILRKFGMQYQPDLVVLGFFAGNDFVEAKPWVRRIAYGGAVIRLEPEEFEFMTFLGRPVLFRSRLFLNLNRGLLAFQFSRRKLQKNLKTFLRLERGRLLFTDPNRAEQYAPRVDWVLESLVGMQDLVTRRGNLFLIAAYPDEFQVDAYLREQVRDFYGLEMQHFQWDRAQQILAQFCRQKRIEFYDLLPAFRTAHNAGQRLYIPRNTHWNRAGNQLAAQLLEEWLLPHVQSVLEH